MNGRHLAITASPRRRGRVLSYEPIERTKLPHGGVREGAESTSRGKWRRAVKGDWVKYGGRVWEINS